MTRGSSLRRLTGTVVATVLGVLALGAAALPRAVAATTPAATIDVQVTNLAPAVLTPGADLTVDVTLRNDGTQAIAHPRASLLISRFRLPSRPALTDWAAGKDSRPVSTVATVDADAPLDPGASASLQLTLPAARVGLLDTPDAWGPRGIAVQASGGGRALGIQRTFLLWQPDGAEPVADLAVLLPVVGPATTPDTSTDAARPAPSGADVATPDAATIGRLSSLTANGGRLSDLLAVLAHPTASAVSVAVDPRLLAQARRAGGTAAAWSSDLGAALGGRDVATLPWADVDAAATVHGGRPDLTKVATDRSTEAELAGHGIGSVLWAPSAPDRGTAALVPRLDLQGLVAPPGELADSTTASHATEPVQSAATDSGDARLLVPDATLTALFTNPTKVEPGATVSTARQRLLAELAVLARRGAASSALVAPARGWDPDPALVGAELDAVAGARWANLVGVSRLRAVDDAPAVQLPRSQAAAAELDPAHVEQLDDARAHAVAFSGVTSDPDVIVRAADDTLLAPLAVAWRADPEGRAHLVDTAVATVTASTAGLSIAPLSDLNVISATSDLRVTVRSALDVAATVNLVVSSRKACLAATNPAPLTIPAHSETGVVVRLHATANCEVAVVARLTGPAGVDVASPVQFTARVAPTIESVGTIVVGVLLAIGLVLGIVRTIRRGQSARRGARDEAEAARQDAPLALAPLGGVAATAAAPDQRPDEDPETQDQA